jgi:formylglycine-generating enzyme required for sulfatase activity
MVYVPAGTLEMGSKERDDTRPVHRVALAAFYLDVTEVTVAAYNACVRNGLCDEAWTTEGCNAALPLRSNHPINCVDLYQAESYCRWQKKRLPSEEEWEYAARGTDGRSYPWGDATPQKRACFRGTNLAIEGTCAAGGYPGDRSPFGLFDMAGNVSEWTASGFSANYAKPRKSDLQVVRGGGWGDVEPEYLSAFARGRSSRGMRASALGFRCARSVRW